MEENLKFLVSASGFELERIRTALSDNGIPNDSKPQKRNFSAKAVTGTDISIQDIYVAESDYEKAYDLCVGIGAIKLEGEETILGEEEAAAVEEFEDMPSGKRTAVRIVSAILFVLLAAMVIFGVDAITGWIKSLF
ncbi:MAG: hypothetical protein IIV05_00595 [Ruminococcus sp.]|nr:hypothetical protein [Ruminococcus sp.]MBQ1308910.1 hypothetical protein [Ruminococcus sp.]MBQ1602134.1 hypothetical protein [Ruminococcus sp.]MBQ1638781.1 hypothetical protein [Ruminococcus sp.]MBQ1687024.1 hypothetical protein [Ruminococcus sp.]